MTVSMTRKPTKSLLATVAVLGATLLAPTAASAKTYKVTAPDPTGDSATPGRDITEVKLRYKTNGSVLFVVTLAGPIDPVAADAVVSVNLGTTCKKLTITGAGLFSKPDTVVFFKPKSAKKPGKGRKGKGEITSNVITLKVKDRSFKDLKPGCMAVGLIDPATVDSANPTLFDETAEIKIK